MYLKNIEFFYPNFEYFVLIALFAEVIAELKLYGLINSCILSINS